MGNQKRMGAVWASPQVYEKWLSLKPNAKNYHIGDISDRLELKKQLGCHDFDWYIDNVFPEFRKMPPSVNQKWLQESSSKKWAVFKDVVLPERPAHAILSAAASDMEEDTNNNKKRSNRVNSKQEEQSSHPSDSFSVFPRRLASSLRSSLRRAASNMTFFPALIQIDPVATQLTMPMPSVNSLGELV